MKCPKCGAEIPDGYIYCFTCGYAIQMVPDYEVDVEEIVPGDLVRLSSGDMIPGDVRFLEVKDLFIDQASLTGESNPVEKFTELKEYETMSLNKKNKIDFFLINNFLVSKDINSIIYTSILTK